jgi:16S rRNA (guanine527-N7)-methyltransferase
VQTAPPGPAVDVGAGAGFPGVPLAIADPSRWWRFLEPRRKRSAFLEEVVRSLGLSAEVVTMRAQEAARDPHLGGGHSVATARALAAPAVAFGLIMPLVAPGGSGIVWAGRRAELPREAEVVSGRLAIIRQTGPGREGELEGDSR